jgi:hypothetical protein
MGTVKFGANCGTSLRACRAELVPRLPVMMSARAPRPRPGLALARRNLRPPESRARWHFSILLETQSAVKQGLGHAPAALQTRHGSAALSNPAVRTCVCQRNRNAVSSTSGKLPTTRSSLRRQLPNQLPSQLRSQRQRSLGSQRQRSLGSQLQRRIGSHRSLCRSHRSLCRSRRSHGLRVPSPEAFPRSPCRRRRTSPG